MTIAAKLLFAFGLFLVCIQKNHGERHWDQAGQPDKPALMKLIQHLVDDYNRHCDMQHRLRLQTGGPLDAKRIYKTTRTTIRRTTPTTTTAKPKSFESFEDMTTHETLHFESDEDHGDMNLLEICAKKPDTNDTGVHKDKAPNPKRKSIEVQSEESSVYSKLDWLFRKQSSGRSRQSILKELSLNKDIFVIKKEPVYVVALKCMNKKVNKKY